MAAEVAFVARGRPHWRAMQTTDHRRRTARAQARALEVRADLVLGGLLLALLLLLL